MSIDDSQLDNWIRDRFCELNTELEELYFTKEKKCNSPHIGTELKSALYQEGLALINDLVTLDYRALNYEQNFNLLGNIGFYMAAYYRHEINKAIGDSTDLLKVVFSLALKLGSFLGVAPRLITSHLTTHNTAINGRYKSFTHLKDEIVFLDYNTRSIFAYKQAANALLQILPLGISHPATTYLLKTAEAALDEVILINKLIYKELDTDRFFYNFRNYYKPHPVGSDVYRGTNGGDFADINIIDLLLGLCSSEQLQYLQLLNNKFLYIIPDDQHLLRDCINQPNLMDSFLAVLPTEKSSKWFKNNLSNFIQVCEKHGECSRQHHNELVEKFFNIPSQTQKSHDSITSSGNPLDVLLRQLEDLRDQRLAVPRLDIYTRYHDIQRLKATLA